MTHVVGVSGCRVVCGAMSRVRAAVQRRQAAACDGLHVPSRLLRLHSVVRLVSLSIRYLVDLLCSRLTAAFVFLVVVAIERCQTKSFSKSTATPCAARVTNSCSRNEKLTSTFFFFTKNRQELCEFNRSRSSSSCDGKSVCVCVLVHCAIIVSAAVWARRGDRASSSAVVRASTPLTPSLQTCATQPSRHTSDTKFCMQQCKNVNRRTNKAIEIVNHHRDRISRS
jgi:hypothetical protein